MGKYPTTIGSGRRRSQWKPGSASVGISGHAVGRRSLTQLGARGMAALTDVRAVLAQTGVIATVVAAEPLALLHLTVASVVLTVHPVLLAHQHS